MRLPNHQMIMEVMLYKEGIHEGEKLALIFDTVMNECKDNLSKQPQYDFGLRKIKHLITATGRLTRKYGDDLNDTDSMFNTLLTHLVPSMVPEDISTFEGMVKKHFPESKVHVSEEEIT